MLFIDLSRSKEIWKGLQYPSVLLLRRW